MFVELPEQFDFHDGLFARRVPIGCTGLMPSDIIGVYQRRFDQFAITLVYLAIEIHQSGEATRGDTREAMLASDQQFL